MEAQVCDGLGQTGSHPCRNRSTPVTRSRGVTEYIRILRRS